MEGMTQFRITYDGPALASHEMDARDLAPALIAMADLLDASVHALYKDRAKAQVNVKGSFKTGSFNIDFTTALNFLQAAKDLFSGDGATAIANARTILELLGLSAVSGYAGLAQVLKWLRGRRIARIEPRPDGNVRIFTDDEAMDVELHVVALLRDLEVRRALDRVLSPLDTDGINTFAAGDSGGFAVVINDNERPFFAVPAGEDELILEDVRKMAFSIVSLAFKEDNKWRLSDGNSTINALISDQAFLARVNANEVSFMKGDVLICMVKVSQWQSTTGAKTDYEVVEVVEHRHAPSQIPMPGLGMPPQLPKKPKP